MKRNAARRIALTGLLFALAMALSFAENALAPLLGLPPGVKPGLANVVVMVALFLLNRRQAAALVVLKAGFNLLYRGGVAGAISLAGGLVSLLVMVMLMLPQKRPSVLIISIAGALAHNLGQFLMVWLLMGPTFLYYLPVLLVAGVVMGSITAALLRVLLPALQKAGLQEPKGKIRGGKNGDTTNC